MASVAVKLRSMRLRDYQLTLKNDFYTAWQDPSVIDVMGVMATGGGKTVVFCSVIDDFNEPAVVIAHRAELVSQASLTLNRERIPHDIIAPKATIQEIIGTHLLWHGHTSYKPGAKVRVASVDTINARGDADPWFKRVRLVIIDEAHHVLESNKWGKARKLFPNARGMFMTAHALRPDGKGLGRGQGGLADRLVLGPCYYDLVQRGFLVPYLLAGPTSDIDISEVHETSTGELNQQELASAWHKSKTIVGDIAQHYVQLAGGKLGLTFVVDIEGAGEVVTEYKKHDVHAAIITGETPIPIRAKLMQKFRDRDILQLVSVDVLGEGTDVPGVEVVSMGRHTSSFQTYAQQFGRQGRPNIDKQHFDRWDTYTDEGRRQLIAWSKKPHGLCIDHVDNWERHLPLPDMPRSYTLAKADRASRKKKSDAIPMRRCLNEFCINQPFERVLACCPLCGWVPPVTRRGSPEQVDGVLSFFDPETLDKLRGLVAKRDAPTPSIPYGADRVVEASIRKRHAGAMAAQQTLRATMALWNGWQKHLGRDDIEAQKRFFYKFGTDVLTAQSVNAQDAAKLTERIQAELDAARVVELL